MKEIKKDTYEFDITEFSSVWFEDGRLYMMLEPTYDMASEILFEQQTRLLYEAMKTYYGED